MNVNADISGDESAAEPSAGQKVTKLCWNSVKMYLKVFKKYIMRFIKTK